MLKKLLTIKLKVFGGIILALILVQLATAYIFGFIVQTQMDHEFKHITDSPLIKVVSHDYHRGLFSSDETTEIAINSSLVANVLKILPNNTESANESSQTYSIRYTTHVEHGIFAGVLNGFFVPTMAYAKTNLIYPDKLKSMLNKFFNNQPPLTIDNIIYLDKSGKFVVYSPTFNYDEAVSGVKVVWGGLTLDVKYNAAFDKFNKILHIPLFQLSAPTKGSMELSNVIYQSDSRDSINKIKIGKTELKVGTVKVEWKDKIALNFKLGDVLHMLTGISSTEFLNGVDAINPSSFAFNNIVYTSISEDSNNFFSANAIAKFDSLITNGKKYGPMNLDMSVSHILSPAFSQLADKLAELSVSQNESSADNDKMRNELVTTLKQYFGPILVNQPIISLNQFELTTPNGLIQISGHATTKDFHLEDMNNQQQFMQKLALDLDFSVPKPVLAYLFVLQMKYLLSAGNAEMDKQSSEALTKVVNILLDNQVNTWVKKGYLTNNNGILGSHLVVANGKLTLNGIASK